VERPHPVLPQRGGAERKPGHTSLRAGHHTGGRAKAWCLLMHAEASTIPRSRLTHQNSCYNRLWLLCWMKLQCDETLSNFAFNFKLRRYSAVLNGGALVNLTRTKWLCDVQTWVWRCMLNPVERETLPCV